VDADAVLKEIMGISRQAGRLRKKVGKRRGRALTVDPPIVDE
jgi:hypothetical protein